MYTLYMHFNRINGKKYIGITGRSLNSRFGKDGSGYKSCVLFWNAIQKYGWDNFEHRILRTDLTEEEAKDLEKKYIAAFQTNDPRFGYNLLEGGQGGPMPQSIKDKMSKAATGKLKSKETKKRMSESRKNKVSIVCVETGETFESIAECAEHLGCDKRLISVALKKGGTSQGFHFEYLDLEKQESAKASRVKKPERGTKIICIETEEVFESINECARKLELARRNLYRALKKGYRCNGLHFEYYNADKGE